MNQKTKSITFNNEQRAHFCWNRQANVINIRNIQIIPISNLLSFQIFSTPIYQIFENFPTPLLMVIASVLQLEARQIFPRLPFISMSIASKTGQAARKSVEVAQRRLMSEPSVKVARIIMPDILKEGPFTETTLSSNGVSDGKDETSGAVEQIGNGHAAQQNGTTPSEDIGDGSELLIKRLSEDAKLPHRGSLHAAGMVNFLT